MTTFKLKGVVVATVDLDVDSLARYYPSVKEWLNIIHSRTDSALLKRPPRRFYAETGTVILNGYLTTFDELVEER